MKTNLITATVVTFLVGYAISPAFGWSQHVASHSQEPKQFRDWAVSITPYSNSFIIGAETHNSNGEILLILLSQSGSGQKFLSIQIASPSNYKPPENEKRHVRIIIDGKKYRDASVCLSHSNSFMLCEIQGIRNTDMLDAFLPSKTTVFAIENYPSPVIAKFSLLGITDALNYMAEMAEKLF